MLGDAGRPSCTWWEAGGCPGPQAVVVSLFVHFFQHPHSLSLDGIKPGRAASHFAKSTGRPGAPTVPPDTEELCSAQRFAQHAPQTRGLSS